MLALLDNCSRVATQNTSTASNMNRSATTLSQYIWKLKNNKVDFKIHWEIITRTQNKYSLKNGCNLCNTEKFEVLSVKKSESLTKGMNYKLDVYITKNNLFKNYVNNFVWNQQTILLLCNTYFV